DQVLIEGGGIAVEQARQVPARRGRRRRQLAQRRQVVAGFVQCRVDRQGGAVGPPGVVRSAGLVQDVAQVVMGVGILRPDVNRLLQGGDGLGGAAELGQRGPQSVQRQRVPGPLGQRLPALPDGGGSVAQV